MALNLPDLRPVRLADMESGDTALLTAKGNRSRIEYFFTCTSSWILYLLNTYPDIERITYLDADMVFFSSPAPIFEEMANNSIVIIPHRFPQHLRHLEIYGVYNVGLLAFRNDVYGRECLAWWRERCIEWCYDRLEDDKFADQKYLDDWTIRFQQVVDLQHIGANVAPWNWMNYTFQAQAGRITVDDVPLIFYHYQGLKLLNRWVCDPGYFQYGDMPRFTRNLIYIPYLQRLRQARNLLQARVQGISPGYTGIFSRAYGRFTALTRLLNNQLMLLRQPI